MAETRRSRPAGNGPATTSNTTVDSVAPEIATVVAEIRETIRQVRAAQAALEAEQELLPPTGCVCGCSSSAGYSDPDCAAYVRDQAAAYRAKIARQRALECRAMPECATPGVVLCLLAGNSVEFVADLFGITVAEAQQVRDAIPARAWAEQVSE